MKKFNTHIAIFIVVVMLSIFGILSLTNGYSDAFYLKISSSKQTNLILGTSKAAQGIQPKILQNHLNHSFFNYAFTMHSSPFGNVYWNSFQKKLDTVSEKNQIFILSVDAWSISSSTKNPNDSLQFRENSSFLNEIQDVNSAPNFNYLMHHFDSKYYKILIKDTTAFLHDDGWLEVSHDDDKEKVDRRTAYTMLDYEEKLRKYQFSEVRYQYLLKTIRYLKKYGEVYLVRLPVHPNLMKVENKIVPDFNLTIQEAIHQASNYLDLSLYNAEFSYTDGVHLDKISGEKVSKMIAEKIKITRK